MAQRTSADYRSELADLTDSSQALLDVAKEENRDLTADEHSQFENYATQIAEKKAELEKAEKFEAHKRELAAMRSMQSAPLSPVSGLPVRGSTDHMQVNLRIAPLRAFKGERAHREAYDCGMWLRAMLARERNRVDEQAEARIASRGWDVVRNTATEGTPEAGGYLVPAPLSNAIIDIRAIAGISRQVARVLPMTSDTLGVPKKVAGTTVYYVGEAQAITPSDQTWAQLELRAKKRAILSYVSQELSDDAIINVMDDLASQMGTDFAVKEDAEFINGDGTSTYGGEVGLLSAALAGTVSTAATGHDTWAELDMADLAAAMGLLPSRFRQYSPVWIMSPSFFHGTILRILAAGGGNNIQTLTDGAGVNRPMFMGYPVYFTDQLPSTTGVATAYAIFGAISQAAIIGDRTGVRIAQSMHAGFENDVLAIRATTRYDILVHEPGTASAAGAYVVLKTAS